VTDRTIALGWPAATDPDGQVMGYVVRRNGVVLGQPTSPGFLARNLAPAASYTFTVTAKDRAGHTSPDSVPLTVTTAAPVPTTGPVYAYLLATTDESFEAFAANYQRVETVSPTFFEVHADGSVSGEDQPRVTQFAKLRGVRVEPRFNNQNGSDLHSILTTRSRGDALIANIARIVAEHGYDGAGLDFESGAASDRGAMTDFVGRLAAALHAQGATLTVDASAKTSATTTGRSGFYDYPALAARADRIFVMAWDLHWASSPAGPISDIRWVRNILAYVRTVGAGRFVIGTNLYGFDWPLGRRAESYRYPAIRALQAAVGALEKWDAEAEEPYFTYTGADGLAHTVYFADTRSVEARMAAVRAAGFQPGVWRIGQEDPAVWTLPSMQP
jgi:spore germination protein